MSYFCLDIWDVPQWRGRAAWQLCRQLRAKVGSRDVDLTDLHLHLLVEEQRDGLCPQSGALVSSQDLQSSRLVQLYEGLVVEVGLDVGDNKGVAGQDDATNLSVK